MKATVEGENVNSKLKREKRKKVRECEKKKENNEKTLPFDFCKVNEAGTFYLLIM